MTDAQADAAYEQGARARFRDDSRRAFRAAGGADGLAQRRASGRGRLTAGEAAARRTEQAAGSGTLSVPTATTATVRQESPSAPPADPDAAFRTGVRGVLGAFVLVFLFLWIRQRRVGVR